MSQYQSSLASSSLIFESSPQYHICGTLLSTASLNCTKIQMSLCIWDLTSYKLSMSARSRSIRSSYLIGNLSYEQCAISLLYACSFWCGISAPECHHSPRLTITHSRSSLITCRYSCKLPSLNPSIQMFSSEVNSHNELITQC